MIDALLALLTDPSQFTGDQDLDLLINLALAGLRHVSELPPRTIDIMLSILVIDVHIALMFTRTMMAAEKLRRITVGKHAVFDDE